MKHAMDQVQAAAILAMQDAQITKDQLLLGYYGLTGADWPDEYPLLQRNIEQLGLTPKTIVNNDCWLSFRAGSISAYGLVVAYGTGPNAAGRSRTGDTYAFGYFADEGGADWLITRMLKAVLWQEDGRGEPTRLTDAILTIAQTSNIETLLRVMVEKQLDRNIFRDLPRLLYDIAYEGDTAALGIIREMASSIARYALALARRLNLIKVPFDLVLGGSLLKDPGRLLLASINSQVLAVTPKARVMQARYEPVVGAALYGLEELGIELTSKIMDNVESSCNSLTLIRSN
jgi:N-acetylglucosamine kinase-like BadF-type ATPase